MGELVQAMALLVKVFDDYAKKDCDGSTLSRGELAELLRNQFPTTGAEQGKVDGLFGQLDGNKDEKVDFEEFVQFVCAIAVICKLNTK